MSADEILSEVIQDKSFYDNTGGGMTISGGEMLSYPAFVSNLIDKAGKEGIGVCLDTSGYGSGEQLVLLAEKENVTQILYDMKSIDDEIHKRCTGKSNKIIMENLIRLCRDDRLRDKIQMRMPLISGINDNWKIISDTADFYLEHGIKNLTLLPYHDLGVSKKRHIGGDEETFKKPDDEELDRIKEYFKDHAHMNVEILGRI